MSRRIVLCVLGAVAALGLTAPAGALADAVVTNGTGGQIIVTSGSQDAENLVISRQSTSLECNPQPTPCLQLANGPQRISDSATGCNQLIFNGNPFDIIVVCSPGSVTSIRLDLNDGDDFASVLDSVPPTTMNGGADDDNLSSASGSDTVLGGPDDDTISDDGGNDTLNGGDGNDLISLGGGNDDVAGGPGTDTVEMDSGDDTVHLDDLANDGPPGAAINIHSDIEIVDGGAGGDNLFGNTNANTLRGGSSNDLLDGGAGDDVLEGGSGADDQSGGPGEDRVVYSGTAAQTITLDDVRNDGAASELDNVHSDVEDVTAGAGNDQVVGSDAANVLDGGPNDDRLEGRGGIDTFIGGPGADAIFARDGLQEQIDCGSEADSGEADTIDLLTDCENVLLSSVLVPDGDGDGVAKPADCDDNNAAIHPGAVDVAENGIDEDCTGADAVNLDRDHDGFLRPTDCDDNNAAIHPGAVDIPGNNVDEDCSGGPSPFPLLPTAIGTLFDFGRVTVFTELILRQVRAGSTLRMTCSGKGCPFRTKTRKLTRSRRKQVIANPLRKARLRPGARFEVRVTKPATIGPVARLTVRLGKPPKRADLCIAPGAKKPSRCPAA
jgi:Ca2+-binding RTX toxin-like protein